MFKFDKLQTNCVSFFCFVNIQNANIKYWIDLKLLMHKTHVWYKIA